MVSAFRKAIPITYLRPNFQKQRSTAKNARNEDKEGKKEGKQSSETLAGSVYYEGMHKWDLEIHGLAFCGLVGH